MLAQHSATNDMPPAHASCLTGFSLLALLAFMLSYKVLSPQFIIWCYPLIPLVTGRFSRLSWLLFIATGLLTFFIYPTGYQGLKEGNIRMIAILLARNAALVGLAFTVACSGISSYKRPESNQSRRGLKPKPL